MSIVAVVSASFLMLAITSAMLLKVFSYPVQRGFDEDWLGDTFSRAVMLGNGLTAILAGLLANTLVDTFEMGPVAPFDAAIVLLSVGGAIIYFTWTENYGSSTSNRTMQQQFMEAVDCIRSDQRVFLLGLMQV